MCNSTLKYDSIEWLCTVLLLNPGRFARVFIDKPELCDCLAAGWWLLWYQMGQSHRDLLSSQGTCSPAYSTALTSSSSNMYLHLHTHIHVYFYMHACIYTYKSSATLPLDLLVTLKKHNFAGEKKKS